LLRCLPELRKIEGDIIPTSFGCVGIQAAVIKIEQIRELLHDHLSEADAGTFKVATLVGADRLSVRRPMLSQNARRTTPDSILILFPPNPASAGDNPVTLSAPELGGGTPGNATGVPGLAPRLSEMAAAEQRSLLGRTLLSVLLSRLNELKEATRNSGQRSPLKPREVDPGLKEKWEDELSAAIERSTGANAPNCSRPPGVLRDIWLRHSNWAGGGSPIPTWPKPRAGWRAVSHQQALENLQLLERISNSDFQRPGSLGLEVGL